VGRFAFKGECANVWLGGGVLKLAFADLEERVRRRPARFAAGWLPWRVSEAYLAMSSSLDSAPR